MTDDSDEIRLPPSLRLLKALVIVLLLTMIAGVLVMIWLFVTRLPGATLAPAPTLPETPDLPAGEQAEAVTFGKGWTAVVTTSGRILIYGTDGALRQEIEITKPAKTGENPG